MLEMDVAGLTTSGGSGIEYRLLLLLAQHFSYVEMLTRGGGIGISGKRRMSTLRMKIILH